MSITFGVRRREAARSFWEGQSASLHRDDIDDFYRRKAEEIAWLIDPADRSVGIVDLGCGALIRRMRGR